jgi:hypothetical protein
MNSTSKNVRLALTVFLSLFEIGGLVVLGIPTFLMFVIAAFGIPKLLLTNSILLIWGSGEIIRMLFGFRSDYTRLFASIRRTICGTLAAISLVSVIHDPGTDSHYYASWQWGLIGLVPVFTSLAFYIIVALKYGRSA